MLSMMTTGTLRREKPGTLETRQRSQKDGQGSDVQDTDAYAQTGPVDGNPQDEKGG